jgi:hypothetical protein
VFGYFKSDLEKQILFFESALFDVKVLCCEVSFVTEGKGRLFRVATSFAIFLVGLIAVLTGYGNIAALLVGLIYVPVYLFFMVRLSTKGVMPEILRFHERVGGRRYATFMGWFFWVVSVVVLFLILFHMKL